jgi:putative multiple sugar transport system permease protein
MSDQNQKKVNTMRLSSEVGSLLKNNVRQYAMYIALVVIVMFFSVFTNGSFLSAGNIVNLINQVGYIAVLAIGMTLVIVTRHIDLSVGYLAGFAGAIAALLLTNSVNVWVTVLIVLVLGLGIGLYQGLIIAYVKVPAFITTLAGMFIFRGLLLLVLENTGTIIVANQDFNSLSNGNIPDIVSGQSLHILTLIIGAVAVILLIATQVNKRANMKRYNFHVVSPFIFWLGILLVSILIMAIIWVLAGQNGIPWTAVIVGVVLFIYNFILNSTRLGRHIYGIGGNPEAALLSGINVKKVTLFIFCSMGMLAALSGILYTSRLQSASPAAGVGFELDAIAAAFIGGAAVAGGVGRVTNSIIGAFIIMSLTNGMNLMGVDAAFQYIVKGIIFVIAVAFDVVSQRTSK